MQGRLLPPINGRIQCFPSEHWREEFSRAAAARLNLIEWIYEVYGAEVNPISNDEGIAELQDLSKTHGVAVRSLCADYFMDRPLLTHPEEGLVKLTWLLGRCHLAGIKRIILPFVDASRLFDRADEEALINLLLPIHPEMEKLGMELHLETDLSPTRFAALIARLPDPVFKINYDSGNSASHGYRVEEEFAAYGTRIGSLHIKDRVLKGGTVPLGQGNVDFPGLRASLESIGYYDDIILQVARGELGGEIQWAVQNRSIVSRIFSGVN